MSDYNKISKIIEIELKAHFKELSVKVSLGDTFVISRGVAAELQKKGVFK